MSQKELRDALFGKIVKFDKQQLSDLLFAANCIEKGIEVYNRELQELNQLRFALKAYQVKK